MLRRAEGGEVMTRKLEQYRDKCRHFNGIGLGSSGKRCRADVDYRVLVGGPDFGWAARIPCLDKPSSVECPSRILMTQDEHADEERRLNEAVDGFLARLDAGQCPTCGAGIEPSKTVGRCLYASCGHRVGQVLDEGDDE